MTSSLVQAQQCDVEYIETLSYPMAVFGSSVARSQNRFAVGAPLASGPNLPIRTGGAVVFVNDGSGWKPMQELWPSDGQDQDRFGSSIVMREDMVIVAAKDHSVFANRDGAVYVFRLIDGEWVETQQLTVSDAQSSTNSNFFGQSMELVGDTLYIGSRSDVVNGNETGAVYMYEFDGDQWQLQSKIHSSDMAEFEVFGVGVEVEGDTMVVTGAKNSSGYMSTVYIFHRVGGAWVEVQRVIPTFSGTPNRPIGNDIEIKGDLLMVADNLWNTQNALRGGAVLVFRNNGIDWEEEALLESPIPAKDQSFGQSVEIHDSGDFAIISQSTPGDRAYVFRYADGQWSIDQEFIGPGVMPQDQFGIDMALDGDSLLMGTPGFDGYAVFRYDVACNLDACPADLTGDGQLNFFDVSAFLAAYQSQDPAADFMGDGSFNFFDVSAFLTAFNAGCP